MHNGPWYPLSATRGMDPLSSRLKPTATVRIKREGLSCVAARAVAEGGGTARMGARSRRRKQGNDDEPRTYSLHRWTRQRGSWTRSAWLSSGTSFNGPSLVPLPDASSYMLVPRRHEMQTRMSRIVTPD